MLFKLQSKGLELTSKVEGYIEKKITRLRRYFPRIESIHVWVQAGKERHSEKKFQVKALLHLPGRVYLSGGEVGRNVEEAVDLLSEKLERQIEKYKNKR